MIRPAVAGDSARCQEIAVAAWRPIYAARREQLGDVLFERLFARWEEQKAGQIAHAFARYPGWILVACRRMHPDGGDTQRGPSGRPPVAALEPGRPGERGALGEQGGDVVGFVTYRLDAAAQVGEIGNNAVDPRWQGRGVATALYRRTLDVFRAAGMRVARVTTGLDAAHAPARAAYGRVGFAAEVQSVTLYREL